MAEEEKSPWTSKLRVVIPSIVLLIGAGFGIFYGIEYWLYNIKHVVTDDARVKGRMVSVAPEVSGTVKVLHVEEGSVIKKGDILLELHDISYRLQLEEAQAQGEMITYKMQEAETGATLDDRRDKERLAHAEAALLSKQGELAEELTALELEKDQVRNQIIEAEAALKEAESTVKEVEGQIRSAMSSWERVQALFQDGIVSAGQRDEAQETLGQAQERRNAAQERVAQLSARLNSTRTLRRRIQLREAKVQTLKAAVEQERADVRLAQSELSRRDARQSNMRVLEAQFKEAQARSERAREDLQNTILRSPVDGVISRQRVEEGQLVQRGQPVLVIGDPQEVWILANIKESYIRDVEIGKTVDIRVDAYPDRRFEGEVDTVGHATISEFSLFPPTGSFTKVEQRIPVQISIDNSNGLLKPGMMVVVGIVKE